MKTDQETYGYSWDNRSYYGYTVVRCNSMIKRKTQFKYFLGGGVLIVLLSVSVNFYYSKKEYKEGFAFIISKVEATPAMRLRLYDRNGNKLNTQQYVFFTREGIVAGDSIVKIPNSNFLTIYRKVEN